MQNTNVIGMRLPNETRFELRRFAFEWDVFGDRSLVMPQTSTQSRAWKRFVTWAIFGSKWARMPA